jgi:glycosyltransferase involved in cell wall biosynthesis
VNAVLKAGYDFLSTPFATKVSDAWLMAKFKRRVSKRAAAKMFFSDPPVTPKVTIVIPVYNVERYLALCLQSVCAQNYPNLDVILVNDGSTDNSLAVARKFQEKLNLHIVDQENSGLSAARNAGVRAIEKTDYLMFLDSDDALAPEALKNLVSQIVDTGADFVVGDTTRMKGVTRLKRRDTRPVFDRASFAKQSAGSLASTTLKEHPQAILDVTAWNRLFDFKFYTQNKFSFPEGMFFEDMALMTKAYIRAKKFSVLSQTVYLWRVRTEGAKSITQQTNDEKKLADRITALRQMQGLIKAGIVMGKTNDNNLEVFKNRVWNHDIPLYKHVPGSRALFDGLLK